MLGELLRRVGVLFGRHQADRDLDDEIRLHLELLEQQQRERGIESDQARALARHRFGNPARIKEDSRDAAGWRWLDDLSVDLRDAVRSLTRHTAYTVPALVTLAVGVGATTAIFSVVSAVILRPLPFAEPDRLVRISGTPADRGEAIALADLEAFRRQATSFDAIAGYAVTARYLRTGDSVGRVMAVLAERSLFDALGVAPLIGRTLHGDDPASVVVVSHRFWRERLGANPQILGTTLDLDDERFTVVGVMPAAFQFPYSSASTGGERGIGVVHGPLVADVSVGAAAPRPRKRGDRPPRARREPSGRRERARGARHATRRAPNRSQPARPRRSHGAARRCGDLEDGAATALVSPRRRWRRAGAGMRQRHQSLARADDAAQPRSRGARGNRRASATAGAPVPHREPAPVAGRRRFGPRDRMARDRSFAAARGRTPSTRR